VNEYKFHGINYNKIILFQFQKNFFVYFQEQRRPRTKSAFFKRNNTLIMNNSGSARLLGSSWGTVMFVHDGETTDLVCGEEGRKIIAIVTNRMGRWWRDEEREATTMIRRMVCAINFTLIYFLSTIFKSKSLIYFCHMLSIFIVNRTKRRLIKWSKVKLPKHAPLCHILA
jgi:hypothetical protein